MGVGDEWLATSSDNSVGWVFEWPGPRTILSSVIDLCYRFPGRSSIAVPRNHITTRQIPPRGGGDLGIDELLHVCLTC